MLYVYLINEVIQNLVEYDLRYTDLILIDQVSSKYKTIIQNNKIQYNYNNK